MEITLVYEKLAIILPGSTIIIDPEMTFKHYVDKLHEKIIKSEVLIFKSADNHACIIYSYIPGASISVITEKKYLEIRREQQYAALQQQSIITKQ